MDRLKHNSHFTEKEIMKMIEMKKAGKTIAEIAKALDRTRDSIASKFKSIRTGIVSVFDGNKKKLLVINSTDLDENENDSQVFTQEDVEMLENNISKSMPSKEVDLFSNQEETESSEENLEMEEIVKDDSEEEINMVEVPISVKNARRSARKFTKEEDDYILKAEKEGMSFDDLCVILKRNRISVIQRFGWLTYGKKHEPSVEDCSIEDILKRLSDLGAKIENDKIVFVEVRRKEYSLN